MAGSLQAYQHV